MTEQGAKRIWIGVAASIAAHVVSGIALLVAPSARTTTEQVTPETEFTIEFTEPEPETPPPVVPPPEDVTPPDPSTPRPPEQTQPLTSRPRGPAPAAVIAMPQPSVSITPDAPQPAGVPSVSAPAPREEGPVETEAQRQERLRILLDPSAVARGSFRIEGDGPSQPQRAQRGVVGGTGTDLVPRSEAEVERELTASLRAEAMTKTHTTRTTLRARPRPDGSFVYSGHAFTAVITPEGEVEYEDRPAVQTEGFSASGSFDLGDMIMRGQGQDPYAAERTRFEEDNAELIARLEAESRSRRMAGALRRLQGQLRRIWENEGQPAAQRRRLIFEQWAEVDESGGGGDARGVIEQFVRDNLPSGSEDGYPADELRRLNATLRGGARFAPY